MNIDLTGKLALVTGAGRGIGREIAVTFAREGMTTIGIDLDAPTVADLTQEFQANGWQGRHYVCDVRDESMIQTMLADIVTTHGRVDVLVNNAGVAINGAVDTFSQEDWDVTHDTNLKGVFLMCRSVIPIMKRQRSGRILNAASFAAIVPSYSGAAYAASKAGVVALTRTLAGELGPWNITVNCYAPGMIPTQMNHFAEAAPERQQRLLDTLSLRHWGQKKHIADLLCFLASDQAEYITGTLIDISGGKLATQIPRVAYEQAVEQKEYEF